MFQRSKAFLPVGYSIWGFYNGFSNNGNFLTLSQDENKYYTNKMLAGLVNAGCYVGIAPVSIYFDSIKLENYVAKVNEK
jgi:hypothetical protein